MRKKDYASLGVCKLALLQQRYRLEKARQEQRKATRRSFCKNKTVDQPPLLAKTLRVYEQWSNKNSESFLKVKDFNSKGTCSVIITIKGHAMCHLLSRGERSLLFHLENDPLTTEIQTQVALDPRVTMQLAKEMNIRHPCGEKGKDAIIMTSDFSVRRRDGTSMIYSFKYRAISDDAYTARQRRSRDLLALEREYWRRQGIEWKLIDRSEVNSIVAYNLHFFRDCADLPWLTEIQANNYRQIFSKTYRRHEDEYLKNLIARVGNKLQLSYDQSLQVFKHLAWHRRIHLPLSEKIELCRPFPTEPLHYAA